MAEAKSREVSPIPRSGRNHEENERQHISDMNFSKDLLDSLKKDEKNHKRNNEPAPRGHSAAARTVN